MKTASFIPDRLNENPAVMRGCSWSEIYAILIQSFCIAFVIGLIVAIFWDNYSTMIGSIPVFASALFWMLTSRMARIKNGRPPGYFAVQLMLKKQRKGFGRYFIEHDGFWKIYKD